MAKPPKLEVEVDPMIYQLMAEQVEDYALFVLDPAGRVTTWNRGAQRIKGYTAEEIIGRHFSTFYTREAIDTGWPQHELKVAAAVGSFEDEGWRLRKNGDRFWASVVITALHGAQDELLGFSKITRDLTERKKQEEALRQSEERFRLLVESVEDYAIFMLDPDGKVSSWNTGAERIKGYRRDEVLGKHFSQFYMPEDLASGKPAAELAAAQLSGKSIDEGWRLKKGGERFWARAIITALHDSAGRLYGFAKFTQDLTDRIHIQHLEKAAKNVSEFIATLAHEMRNPLAPIRSAVQVMGKLPTGDPAYEAMRQMIDRQSAHLTRIVDDMIDISRISRGTLSIQRIPLDIAEAVRRSVETALPLIEAGHHRLDIDLPEKSLLVEGDVNRLTQLLTNLLNNSARYTAPGGSITIKAFEDGGNTVVKVCDTGRGIEAGMLEQVFHMFVQGRTALEKGGGLGIGLALARRLAELHGGTLQAHSEGEGKGSEFTFRMPSLTKVETTIPRKTRPAPVKSIPPLSQRILVVDDNVDAAEALELLLQSLGHETRVVHNGLAVVAAATEFLPQLVLLDIGLPGLDGYEVARRLQTLKKDHPFRIVAITGWGQEADRSKAKEAGFDLHLVKPVDLHDLDHALGAKTGGLLH